MALLQSDKYYVRMAKVVSGDESTVPTTWTVILDSDTLTSITEDAATDSPSVTTVDKKVHFGTPTVTNSWGFEGIAKDDSTQVSALLVNARAKDLMWIETFQTLATVNTVATGDKGTRFQGYIGSLNLTFPATDAVTLSFSADANETNTDVTNFTVTA